MSEDFHELASAYLDGETTDEETGLAENDPEVQSILRDFRSVSDRLTVTSSIDDSRRETHIATALAAFTAAGSAQNEGPTVTKVSSAHQSDASAKTNVVSLSDAAIKRNAVTPIQAQPKRAWYLPAASAAAVVLVAAAGFTFLKSADPQSTASDSAAATATASDGAGGSSDDKAGLPQPAESKGLPADSQVEESAEAADTDQSDDEAEDAAKDDQASTTVSPDLTFSQLPPTEELLRLVSDIPLESDLGASLCGSEVEEANGDVPLGYVPITVDGQPGELFVYGEASPESVIAVDENCQVL